MNPVDVPQFELIEGLQFPHPADTSESIPSIQEDVTVKLYKQPATWEHIGHLRLDIQYPLLYLREYSDLHRAFGPGAFWAARDHFWNFGRDEGRCPSPFFDPSYYVSIHSDLRGMNYTEATEHWVGQGIEEGRRGSRVFHLKYYYDAHPDLHPHYPDNDYVGAFNHWKRHGHLERRHTTSDGPRLLFYQADFSFGDNLDQPHYFGTYRDPERDVCAIGYTLCLINTMFAPEGDERCQAILDACGGTPHERSVFREIDRNQYEHEQRERNAYTA